MTRGHGCATMGTEVPVLKHIVAQQWEPRSEHHVSFRLSPSIIYAVSPFQNINLLIIVNNNMQ
jgi:hypothetical protein